MGGVGKTALMRAAAARVGERFGDGRFEVNLHGSSPNGRGNTGWQYRIGIASDPVARMRMVGGDHERCPWGIRMLHRERARRPGQPLGVGRPPSQVASGRPCRRQLSVVIPCGPVP
jgi:hypothetical protein